MGQHPIELVEPNDGADDAVTHHEVVRRGQSVPRWLALPAACVALLLVWLLVGPGDEEVETAGFVVAEAEALGYQIAAAFDDTNVAADGATRPLVRAFAPAESDDAWAEAFLLFASAESNEAPLRGEVVDIGGTEALYDPTGAAQNVRWVRAEQVLTVRSAQLSRDQLIDAAAAVAASDTLHRIRGFDLLHEGPFRDFTTRPVHVYGDIAGTAGVAYDRLDEPSAAVVLTWATAGPALLSAPTVTSPSASRTTVNGHEAVTTGPDPFSELLTVSWMQDGQLVQLVGSTEFPGGIDGLVEVASQVMPVDQQGLSALLDAHQGPVQRPLRRALPDDHVGSDVARLRSEIRVGVEVTVVVQESRSGGYLLRLQSELGGRTASVGLADMDVTTAFAVDLPASDSPGLFVIAGIAPPGTTHVSPEAAEGSQASEMWPLNTTHLPGTDHLLFIQPVSIGDGSHRPVVVLHHGDEQTEVRL